MVLNIIKDELNEIKNKYGDERRTKIIEDEGDIDIEDLIEEEESVITLTHFGYIKRIPADTYKSQRRGGKGITGLSTREEDFVENCLLHQPTILYCFSQTKARSTGLKHMKYPNPDARQGERQLCNLLELDQDERVQTVIPVAEYKEDLYLVLATKNGIVKRVD